VTATIVFIQGGGDGAHDEDALLAEDLRRRLDDGFRVDFPVMPQEGDPDAAAWGPAIAEAITNAERPVVLVGHSVGGVVLLEQLADQPASDVAALVLIAVPFPSGDPDWTFEGFELPDLGVAIPKHAEVLLYASEDDRTVPFAHRSLWAEAIPGSVVRTTTGGHQLGNDLHLVADDIRRIVS
jgi:predicted alpha/beta hydrolase family esterase